MISCSFFCTLGFPHVHVISSANDMGSNKEREWDGIISKMNTIDVIHVCSFISVRLDLGYKNMKTASFHANDPRHHAGKPRWKFIKHTGSGAWDWLVPTISSLERPWYLWLNMTIIERKPKLRLLNIPAMKTNNFLLTSLQHHSLPHPQIWCSKRQGSIMNFLQVCHVSSLSLLCHI